MHRDSPAETDGVESSDRRTRAARAGSADRTGGTDRTDGTDRTGGTDRAGGIDREVTRRARSPQRGDAADAGLPTLSRRDVVKTGAVAGLGALGTGASATAGAQPATEVPSYEEAAEDLSHPDPSEGAVALYRYLHDEWGERILSGQQYEPWGIDEMDHVESVTGRLPAVQGADFIHDDKTHTVDQTLEWWDRGGITAIMWHWGVPGLELDDEYEESRDTYIQNENYDVSAVLEEGTDANDAFWAELDEVADHLETLRDEGVPVVWRPFHEFEGGWFWWGMEGPDFFVELWETMHEHYVEERDLDNLVWLLPHTGNPEASWVPDASTYDLAGADNYGDGRSSSGQRYDSVASIHGEDRPIPFHECGTPPNPDSCAQDDAWWSFWIVWHTNHLENTADDYLDEVYNHELTATLEDVPDVVTEYGTDDGGSTCGDATDAEELSNGDVVCSVEADDVYRDVTGDGSVTNSDVTQFFGNQHVDPWNARSDLFDFTGDGDVGQADVVDLFQYVSGT